MDDEVIIITRHPGAVEWLHNRGVEGKVLPRATRDDVYGRVVIGNPPMHLAYLAKRVGIIDLPNVPTHLRGRELTAEEMERYGARISWYRIYADGTRHRS